MKKPLFVLSRKNQKGQVAIFVALIFQVIFVFFALLINVGLLVHHKINLQQSTDLAAYYGAMKQAESLNAIAHINFQIRQAWKLLTWRYRVIGSFGFDKWQGGGTLQFPLELHGDGPAKMNASGADSGKCVIDADSVNTVDVPFFCIGHNGMKGWNGGNENMCRFNCGSLTNIANVINKVPGVTSGSATGDSSIATSVNTAIDTVNDNNKKNCEILGPANLNILGGFIVSYYLEEKARSETLLMLAANLSNADSEKVLDLDGRPILEGVKKTLKNNLTEANASSLVDSKIKVINGLSNDNCRIDQDPNRAGAKDDQRQFLKRIEFSFIQLYLQACKMVNDNPSYTPRSVFNADLTAVEAALNASPDLVNVIQGLEANKNRKFSVGYEKNPWCESYYSVKAESEPKIPFLPISKIKLTAIATAKPFGGSIGPWFGKQWPSGAINTQDSVGTDQSKQTDPALPMVNVLPADTATIKDNAKIMFNFSKFIGDTKGLGDSVYLAQYHAALVDREPSSGSVASLGGTKSADANIGNGRLSSPASWPSLQSWKNSYDITNSNYDPLTKENDVNDSYLRDLEISAISPNQFDLAYYSIDADFYNNYYKRISDSTIFGKLKSSAGIGPTDNSKVRPDFGFSNTVYSNQKTFSVRNQIEIVAKIFKGKQVGTHIVGTSTDFLSTYPELATKQSSLLTGWTFANLSDFNTFPDADVTSADGTMSFGRCRDTWQVSGSDGDYKSPLEVDANFPPTPGNCVTGGRVGYSVKLISPSLLREGSGLMQPLGGPGTSGPVLNPIPESFFSF